MEPRQEIANFKDETVLKIFMHKLRNVSRHCHQSLELLFVLSGSVEVRMEDKSYHLSEDDLILVNSNQIHELHSFECVLIILQINAAFVRSLFPTQAEIRFNCNSALHSDQALFQNIKVILAKLIKKNTEEGKYLELINRSLLYELFYELFKNHRFVEGVKQGKDPVHQDRANRIINYINENHTSYISLESLAEQENLSVSYLSRFFKDNIGQTFKSFLNSVRLVHAVNELVSTEKTIIQIAAETGFTNTRSFVAAFQQEYNEYPNDFRKKALMKSQSQPSMDYTRIEKSQYLKKLSEYLREDFKRDVPVMSDKNVVVGTDINMKRDYRDLHHNFRNVLSIGNGRAILFAEYQSMLREVQTHIGYRYLLFHSFFDDHIKKYIENSQACSGYTFELADKIIDTALRLGFKPMMKLGIEYGQTSLISGLLRRSSADTDILDRWEAVIDNFVGHLIHKYGRQEVIQWNFLLQEEYDRNRLKVDISQENRFNELYYSTYKTIKSHDPQIPFGPSPLMPYMLKDTRVLSVFHEFCGTHDCYPDFLTFKYFPVIPEQATAPSRFLLDKNPAGLDEFIAEVELQMQSLGRHHTPVYLTDWNSSTSNSDLLNDTCFKSSYIVRNILQNYDRLKSFGYWTLSDFNFELPPAEHEFHGGSGLFTKNAIAKPSFYALKLLSRLKNRFIAEGEGYFITGRDGEYAILTYNYSHYSALYAAGESFDMTFHERYTPFVDSQKLEICLHLNHLESGTYLFTQTSINRRSGSPFDTWTVMSSLPIEDEADIGYLRSVSLPEISKSLETIENGEISLTVELEPHEVRLVEIIKTQCTQEPAPTQSNAASS